MFFPLLLLILAFLLYRFVRRQRLKAKSYDWYKAQYPQLVTGGRVRCFKCDGANVGTERMMNRMFLRAHICRQCGTVLYYSKES